MFENAKWISDFECVVSKLTGYRSPAKELRKVFFVNEYKDAIINISGLGCFILYINGKRVNDDYFTPSFSQYEKHTYYTTYDVSSYLKVGKNVICVVLGDGFYNQTTEDTWLYYASPSRDSAKLILELFVDDKETVISDTSFKVRQSKTIIHQAIRTGEVFDSRLKDNWLDLEYDDSDWYNARIIRPTGGKLIKMEMPYIKTFEEYKPISITKYNESYILDFGVNISGFVGFKLKAYKDAKIDIDYSEKIKDGDLDKSNIDIYISNPYNGFQKDTYYFSSNEYESWHTNFAYHGFRYAKITGLKDINKDDFTAYFMHTDLRKIAEFNSSDDDLNWIFNSGIRSFLSNYFSVPTDCPQREKNGWTGDASLSSSYAVILYDMKESYKKYIQDIVDTQLDNGQICCIAPTSTWGYTWGSGPAWDSAMFFIPYELYLETGDTSIFDIMYEAGKKYLEYANYYRENNLVCFGLGDWCPPIEVKEDIKIMSNKLSDSCYYYKIQYIMSEIAKIKGDLEYSNKVLDNANKTKEAIKKEFINNSIVDNNGIGAMSTVIYFNIVNGTERDTIANNLVKELERINYKSYVGILGMKSLLNALSLTKHNDIAYKVLKNTEYPSYLYLRSLGATTLFENFEIRDTTSLNHHMYNEPLNYMIRNIAGLKNTSIGYKTFIVEPYIFNENYSSASINKETEYGMINVSWKYENNTFILSYKKPKELDGKLMLGNNVYILDKEDGLIEIKK